MRRSVAITISDIGVLKIFQPALVHRGDVKTNGHLFLFGHAKVQCHLAVALALSLVHRLGGQTKDVALARLNFHKTIVTVLKGDDVRLAVGRFVVALDEFIALLF